MIASFSKKTSKVTKRVLRMESLESREMLSVNPLGYEGENVGFVQTSQTLNAAPTLDAAPDYEFAAASMEFGIEAATPIPAGLLPPTGISVTKTATATTLKFTPPANYAGNFIVTYYLANGTPVSGAAGKQDVTAEAAKSKAGFTMTLPNDGEAFFTVRANDAPTPASLESERVYFAPSIEVTIPKNAPKGPEDVVTWDSTKPTTAKSATFKVTVPKEELYYVEVLDGKNIVHTELLDGDTSGLEKTIELTKLCPKTNYKINVQVVEEGDSGKYIGSKATTVSFSTKPFVGATAKSVRPTAVGATVTLKEGTGYEAKDSGTDYLIEYAKGTVADKRVPDWDNPGSTKVKGDVKDLEVALADLAPGTEYYYRIYTTANGITAISATKKFKTASLPVASISKSGYTLVEVDGKSELGLNFSVKVPKGFAGVCTYELYVSSSTSADRTTGLLADREKVTMSGTLTHTGSLTAATAFTVKEEKVNILFSNVLVALEASIGGGDPDVTDFKSVGMQLEIAYAGVSGPLQSKVAKLALPTWLR